MKLITWNVQWCRGVDGRVDPARVVAEAKRLADFDVLCLQEIADNFPIRCLAGSAGEDQFARARVAAARLHGGARASRSTSPATDGRRRRFGNMILSRLPVLQAFRHLLPYPGRPRACPACRAIAVEAVRRARRSATCA